MRRALRLIAWLQWVGGALAAWWLLGPTDLVNFVVWLVLLAGLQLAVGWSWSRAWSGHRVDLSARLRRGVGRLRQRARVQRLARMNLLLGEAVRIGAEAADTQAFDLAVCRAAVASGAASQAWIARSQPASQALRVAASWPAQDGVERLPGHAQARQAWDLARICHAWLPAAAVVALPLRGAAAGAQAPRGAQRQGQPGADAVEAVLVYVEADAGSPDEVMWQALAQLRGALEHGLQALAQRARMARLQSLYRALMNEGEALLQARSVPDMLLHTCRTLTEGTPFHAVWMARPDELGRIEVLARAGDGAERLDNLRISLHDANQKPLVIRAWKTRQQVCCNDLQAEPDFRPWRESMAAYDWRSALAVPVRRAGVMWAVLVLVAGQVDAFDRQTCELCERIAELFGHGLDELDTKRRLSELQVEESHRARHDPLTGLPNRFALTQYLPQALSAARQEGSWLAVGMIDLDDFKAVNDTWGHAAGDQLLRELGQRLRAALRRFDMLARLGGDEFVVVLGQLDGEHALAQLADVLQRLHEALQPPIVLGEGRSTQAAMTMGLALFPLDGDDADGLLRQADAAMYQAKLRKHERRRWWRLAAGSSAQLDASVAQAADPDPDPDPLAEPEPVPAPELPADLRAR